MRLLRLCSMIEIVAKRCKLSKVEGVILEIEVLCRVPEIG